jgi:hypothetical protein
VTNAFRPRIGVGAISRGFPAERDTIGIKLRTIDLDRKGSPSTIMG